MLKYLKILTLLWINLIFAQDFQDPNALIQTSINLFYSNQKTYLAVTFKNQEDWHSYWLNPGEAGSPIETAIIYENRTIQLNDVITPQPKRYIEAGTIVTFGHTHSYTYFYDISSKIEDLPEEFEVEVKWLACNNICVPGTRLHGIFWDQNHVFKVTNNRFKIDNETLATQYGMSPQIDENPPQLIDLILTKNPKTDGLTLYYSLNSADFSKLDQQCNLLTPFQTTPLTFKKEDLYTDDSGTIFGKIEIDWDGIYLEPEMPLPTDGKFEKPITINFIAQNLVSKNPYIISKTFDQFLLTPPSHFETITNRLNNVGQTQDGAEEIVESKDDNSNKTFWYYILFALLGGLILNIMPCVLPVISFKLFGLIKGKNESHLTILKHNLFYTLGVLASFLILALVVIILKLSGESVGWGFQLQSINFVSIMVIALVFFAFNLFGLFEIPVIGGKTLGGVKLSNGPIGNFLGGVFATILATPCSAPFLGTALTFAFTSSYLEIIFIFLAIGLGLSAPFIITAIFPKLLILLPKPGAWMDTLKRVLGLSVLVTAIWLEDILLSLSSAEIIFLINIAMSLLLFTILIIKNQKIKHWFSLLMIALSILSMTNLFIKINRSNDLSQTDTISFEPWSEQKMAEYKETGHIVFIDFTAKWCLTCKVNKLTVIETDAFNQLAKEYNLKLLRGDWTKKDPIIEKFLKEHGYVGVPAYFIQDPSGKLIDLGETISIDEIKSFL